MKVKIKGELLRVVSSLLERDDNFVAIVRVGDNYYLVDNELGDVTIEDISGKERIGDLVRRFKCSCGSYHFSYVYLADCDEVKREEPEELERERSSVEEFFFVSF